MSGDGQYPGQPQYRGQPQQPGQPQYPGQPQQPLPGGGYPGTAYSAAQYPIGSYGAPQPAPSGGGIAIAALVVGIVAFLLGWIPILGFIIAVVGIILGVVAVRKPQRKGFGWAAIALSALAALTSIATTIFFLVIPLTVIGAIDDPAPDPTTYSSDGESDGGSDGGSDSDVETWSTVSGQEIDTPCWSYDGPQYFVNNISTADAEACFGALELWGEWQDDGTFKPTGGGDVAGQIQVDPYSAADADSLAPGGDVDAVVDAIESTQQYFSQQGTIISLHEPTTIGGVPATITRVDSNVPETKTKAFITVLVPEPYQAGGEQLRLFIISVTTPYDNGDEQIDHVIDTWEWK